MAVETNSINIERTKCVKCFKCVEVCPAHIFRVEEREIKIADVESCIQCGHCAAVCKEGAVMHSLFPKEKIHKIEYSQMPTPESVMLLCKARRSNRAFTKKSVPTEQIKMILEAAHRAPTASNLQQIEFLVVTKPEEIRMINKFVVELFGKMVKKLENPLLKPLLKAIMGDVYRYVPVYYKMKEAYENGGDLILRGATAVIFIHAPKGSRFGATDGNLAYQNASLMAESLGLSQLYTGFVCTAIKMGKGKLERELGMPAGREIVAGMGLGIPKFRFENYIDKKELKAVIR